MGDMPEDRRLDRLDAIVARMEAAATKNVEAANTYRDHKPETSASWLQLFAAAIITGLITGALALVGSHALTLQRITAVEAANAEHTKRLDACCPYVAPYQRNR